MKTKYFGVIGNRDHIKIKGEKRPFWEFLDQQPDGWLTSLVYKRDDLPEGKPMIFDCGAWSYRNDDLPPVDADSVLESYRSYASSGSMLIAPDHMLIEGVDLDVRRHWNTFQASKFLEICPDEYVPMAAIHGMDLDERLSHASELAKMGYEHIAIGGVAARASQKRLVIGMVDKIRREVPDVWLHVLGLSSPDYMKNWSNLGIQSADGSSHFKQAFTGGAFFTVEGEKLIKHKAIRPDDDLPDGMPICECTACVRLRDEGIDTRSYGSNENNMGRAAHNMNMLMSAQRKAMEKTLVLVACCGKKLKVKAAAQDIYQSELFKKSRAWAEINGDEWAILSAEYGILSPQKVINPYDKTLKTMCISERKSWSNFVRESIERHRDKKIIVLAGNDYCGWITSDLDVDRPMSGMGIGQQLSWLNKQIEGRQIEISM
jgi:hypothetical protein